MGKVTDHGWSTSSNEIAEPTSIVMGKNLRQNSPKPSKSQKAEKPQGQEAESPSASKGCEATTNRSVEEREKEKMKKYLLAIGSSS